MDDSAADRQLPRAPEELLTILREAEARLGELDALRAQIQSLRGALEETPLPTVEDAAARIGYTVEGADEAHMSDAAAVQVYVPAAIPSGEAFGQVTFSGEAHGTASEPSPAVRSWVERVRPWGTAGYRVTDLALRAYSALHGGPPPLA